MLKDNFTRLALGSEENLNELLRRCGYSSDINTCPVCAGRVGCRAVWCEGMTNQMQSWEMLFKQIKDIDRIKSGEELIKRLTEKNAAVVGSGLCEKMDDAIFSIMSGFIVLFIDGTRLAVVFPAQGFSFRSVSESCTEENMRGSREGFVEPLKINLSLIRRRLKSGNLVFTTFKIGTESHTEVAVAYLKDRVANETVQNVVDKLKGIDIEMVLESGFIEPFLENERHSLFSGVGHTERPDTFCGKLREGRIGVVVDGTPYALLLPYLFADNFTSFDDFTGKPYYSSFIRILKYAAFFVSFMLPGFYVAIVYYCPEIIPEQILYNIAMSQNSAGLPLVFEAMFIHVIYEIIREAGLRLPRPVGHAVGLVGALVVGDAAVTVGLVSTPMVLIIALTAISSFMIPTLYEPVSVLRFVFIIAGGWLGPAGIAAGLAAVLLNIASIDTYGVPFLSPISPAGRAALSDGIIVRGWRYFERSRGAMIKNLPGSRYGAKDSE